MDEKPHREANTPWRRSPAPYILALFQLGFPLLGSPIAHLGDPRPRFTPAAKRTVMSLGTILLILLVLLLIGALPTWPHSRNWGYYPSGGLTLLLVILVVLVLTNRI